MVIAAAAKAAADVKERKEQQRLGQAEIIVEHQQHREQQADQNDEAGRGRDDPDELDGGPLGAQLGGWIVSGLSSEKAALFWRCGRKIAGEPIQVVSSRSASAGLAGGAERQPMRTLSPMTVSGGSMALLPINERLPMRLCPMVTEPLRDARRAQRDAVGNETFLADDEQVGRDEGGGGDFGALAELGAEQLVPGRQIDRGVERAEHVEAQVHGLVHEPFAQVVEAVERVAAWLDLAQQQPFHARRFPARAAR